MQIIVVFESFLPLIQ